MHDLDDKMKPIVAVDLDGVVCDFDSAACDRFGPCDRTSYSLEKRWPNRHLEIRRFVTNPVTYLLLNKIPLAQYGIQKLIDLGFEPIAVTARPPSFLMWVITKIWLAYHRIPIKRVLVVHFEKKVDIIKTLGAVAAIDDAPAHLQRLAEHGISAIAFHQRWNSSCPVEYRIKDWEQFVLGDIPPCLLV